MMIRETIETIVATLETAGITATADSRHIDAPCCFVTVTRIDRPTLGDAWRVTGEILAIVRDLGGMADIDAISALVDDTIGALDPRGVDIETIETNQQATPPNGGTLPAARLTYTAYIERTPDNGD